MEDFVVAERLGRRYGQHWAVRDLTLNIKRGEVFGLLGPNGAGKTSTMRMLSCLVAPSEGKAYVCGYDISKQQTEIRKHIAILTESAGLYESLSAEENLRFFAKLYDLTPGQVNGRAEHYLKLLGLWERRKDPAGTFSSGMKQKLSMARALIHEPSVMLLDEPTSALDPEGAKLVRDFIGTLKDEGRTIILCTHNLVEAQSLCDRVAIVKKTLLRCGTPRQLQISLYGRQVEFRLAPPLCECGESAEMTPEFLHSINEAALSVAAMAGVGDVAVSDNSLFASMEDPDLSTPRVVRFLIEKGYELVRVAEVEQSLERAYLDLVARPEQEQNLLSPSIVGAIAV